MTKKTSRVAPVKGTRDLLPPESELWTAVESTARRIFARYGYEEIRTPMLEHTELFVRGVGESSDIVGKEMYTFPDKKGRSLTLRPESTASVARAFVTHNLQAEPLPRKLFYFGPQFRYERPQKGRYRQFSQIGAELFGDPGPYGDAELLVMLVRFLEALHFEGVTVLLNSVGDQASRARYGEALRQFLEPKKADLSEDSQRRFDTNPLRILDSKNRGDRSLLEGAPSLSESLSEECVEHFEELKRCLDEFGVAYRVDPRLVRGLDYYTKTVFEIVSENLGAQNAILGGGRYDKLVEELGGPSMPGIGFAIGQDRLISLLPEAFCEAQKGSAPIVVLGAGLSPLELLRVAELLRGAGFPVLSELQTRSMKAALKGANRARSAVCGPARRRRTRGGHGNGERLLEWRAGKRIAR